MGRARRALQLVPPGVRDLLRPAARRLGVALPEGAWERAAVSPWTPPNDLERRAGAWCVICRWRGEEFLDGFHSELARCPQCGSIARDRWLFWCFVRRATQPELGRLRVIENSPRLGDAYRTAMATWFEYRASDYDGGSHRGDIVIDLQDIALADASVDVFLSSHVLEHVPDTDRALAEIRRVLAPGGRLVLQVPVLAPRTAPPPVPEFHEDAAEVFWRFGFDLGERLRAAGFATTLLVTEDWVQLVEAGSSAVAGLATGDIDLVALLDQPPLDATIVADSPTARRLGFLPSWMFFTWECRVP